MSIQETFTICCLVVFSLFQSTSTMEQRSKLPAGTCDEKAFYDCYQYALNTVAEIDDIAHKAKYTLTQLERAIIIVRDQLTVPEEDLLALHTHCEKLRDIKKSAESIIEQEATLGEYDGESAMVAMKKLIKDSREKSPLLFSDLLNTQEQIRLSLPHFSLVIRSRITQQFDIIKNQDKDKRDRLAHFARVGAKFTTGLQRYQGTHKALTQLEPIYDYFFDSKQMSNHFVPLVKSTEQAIEITKRLHEQYNVKFLSAQQELVDEIKDITEKFKLYNKLSEIETKHDIVELKDVLEKSKRMILQFMETTELQKISFVTKATVMAIEKAKRDSEREIETLQDLIEKVEKKKDADIAVSHVHNAKQMLAEAKKCPFFIVLPAMAGSYFEINQQKTLSQLIYLGSSKTDKVPLAKAGKINSKKGILPAPLLVVETANEKINMLLGHTQPTQLWTDRHGKYYISDREKDKEYAYRLTQVIAIEPQPQVGSSSQHTPQPKV